MPQLVPPISSQESYHDIALSSPPHSPASAHMATTTLKVEGMTCGACTSAVESAFKDVSGVGNVSVSLVMERAVVQHDPDKISADAVKETIEDRGFDAQVLSSDVPLPQPDDFEQAFSSEVEPQGEGTGFLTTTVSVGGMTCGACTSAVEGAFKDVAGIKSFSISLMSERAVIEHDNSIISPERISEIIEDTGFDARVVISRAAPAPRRKRRRRRESSRKKSMTTATIVGIEGMTCGACTSAVESGFKDVKGVVRFNISLLAERAIVTHNPSLLSTAQIVEVVEDRGFDATIISSNATDTDGSSSRSTVQLKIYGMVDSDAALDLESRLSKIPGIIHVNVSPKSSRAMITMDTSVTGLRVVVDAIEASGYNALLADADDNNAQLESLAKTKEIQEWRRAFWISVMFAIPVFLTSMIFPMRPFRFLDYGSMKLPVIPGLWLGDLTCLILTVPVQFGIGRRFYRSAFKSLRHGSPTMDVLVVTGTTAAFFFSVVAMLVSIITPPHSRPATVFDTSTMLITFITMGRMLENGAKSQTSKALSRLMSLAPSMATIYADPIAAEKLLEAPSEKSLSEKSLERVDSKAAVLAEEKTIPTELIQVSDIVILRPGDKVPADGTVIRGTSHVDESMVTGEAMPISKAPDSALMAGTVNGAGRLDFRVTRAGRDTQLSQIVRLVQEAQTSRAPVQRMADLVAGYFVPVILSLGAVTFIAWMILSHVLPQPPGIFLDQTSGGAFMVCLKLCISVIVFACPCALGLSTPTAVMVGTGVGAEQGILVKGGEVLETATRVTHIVFDKTGTLTTGKMSVASFSFQLPSSSAEDDATWQRLCWTIIGLAEMSSEHPIGKAIMRAAREHLNLGSEDGFDGTVDSFEATVGKGISATVTTLVSGSASRRTLPVIIGNASFLRSRGINVSDRDKSSTLSDISATSSPTAGTTSIHIAISQTYTGFLHLADTLKPSALPTIGALLRMGITSSLITGDAQPTAIAIADACGIPRSNVHASCTPSQKQSLIQTLQSQPLPRSRSHSVLRFLSRGRTSSRKHIVAMVGDGINDSPALASSSLGISLSSGTDVAMEAADVVLMHAGPNDLVDVPAALHLSRTIFSRIRLNLVWACGYNLIGLPFAMGIFLPWGVRLPPMAAGAAMAASSVSVVGSSLLLRFWRRPRWMDMGPEDGGRSGGDEGETPYDTFAVADYKEPGLLRRALYDLGIRIRSFGLSGLRPSHSRRRSRAEERSRGAYVPLQGIDGV